VSNLIRLIGRRLVALPVMVLGVTLLVFIVMSFSSADPARVIPSSIVGGAIAGAISMNAHVASPAPHGGIWIIGLSNNIPMFLLAVVAGTVVSAIIYVLLKSIGAKSRQTATETPAKTAA